MELEGKIVIDLPLQSGTSKAGNPWKKKEWVLETFGNYPKKVKIQAFGDRVDNLHIEPGKSYRLGIDLESREFNGRWYTDVSVYSAQELVQQQPGYQQPSYGGEPQTSFGQPQAPAAPGFTAAPAGNDEDLPF